MKNIATTAQAPIETSDESLGLGPIPDTAEIIRAREYEAGLATLQERLSRTLAVGIYC